MSYLLYNVLASIAYGAAAPVLHALRVRNPGEWGERMGHPEIAPPSGPRLWIHAASVGELTGVGPLVKSIRSTHPSCEIVVSTMTRTGQRTAGEIAGVTGTFYLPLDIGRVVRRSIEEVGAQTLIVMETEIWPNLFREAGRRGMKISMLNARISGTGFRRYRPFRGFLAEVLEHVDLFGVQSDTDRRRFLALGADPRRVLVLGSSKYDAIPPQGDGALAEELRFLLGDRSSLPVWVAGCVRPGEESPILDGYQQVEGKRPHVLVLAPRHLERVDGLEREVSRRNLRWVRWTRVRQGTSAEMPVQVILLDTIGDLGRFYKLAAFSYVGGGIAPLGGHNPLEPAALGVPVIFGKHMDNYRIQADRLVEAGGGVEVEVAQDIADVVDRWLKNPDDRKHAGDQALRVVAGFRGAARRAVQAMDEHDILPRDAAAQESRADRRVLSSGRPVAPRAVVSAVSVVHEGVSAVNRWLYGSGIRRGTRLDVPVLSVGNLSLGGTGKTPMVAYLAARFVGLGRRVGILTRGYGSSVRSDGVSVVTPEALSRTHWAELGDEPCWLARMVPDVPVLVGKSRVRSGRHAEQILGCDLLVLDDGFQHLALERDLDIVLLDSRSWSDQGRFMGEHWLREGLAALSRADVLILTHRNSSDPLPFRRYLENRFPHLPVAECRYRATGLRHLCSGDPVPLEALSGESVAAVSGLAAPARFEETLENLGARVDDRWRYSDHHVFTRAEVESITRRALSRARWIVTTEKDGVRLESLSVTAESWLVLSVVPEFLAGEKDLEQALDGMLREWPRETMRTAT
ncbi:MAG: tetraacyldisaccharide 4'-kinase [Candidatus Eisenbacteria sp.]|nr:tetraacyldisaccharide 4'-kinase [Candidatus Eisenbacteria bacterium]